MPMLNLAHIIKNPIFNQIFAVHRKLAHWESGRLVQTEINLTFSGIVVNANPKELFQSPNGDRIAGEMNFYTNEELYTTHVYNYPDINASGTSDEIDWKGNRYRILNINNFSDYGFYRTVTMYMEGD